MSNNSSYSILRVTNGVDYGKYAGDDSRRTNPQEQEKQGLVHVKPDTVRTHNNIGGMYEEECGTESKKGTKDNNS